MRTNKVFVGITGASGSVYGIRLVEELLRQDYEIFLCFSKAGLDVAQIELALKPLRRTESLKEEVHKLFPGNKKKLTVLDENNLISEPASGSNKLRAVFIAPCSMSTLAHIAYGTNKNLIHRAAEVALKQNFPLILLPRETPVSLVHLRAMTQAAESGARIVLPSPAFYHHPETIQDIVDFVVGKMLDAANIDNDLYERWRNDN